MFQSPTLELQGGMDYEEANLMVVPRKPRTRPLGCKRRLNFNDTSLTPKRCRFDDTDKRGPMEESHGLTPDTGNLKKFHVIGSTSVHIGSSGREEKTVAKEDRAKASAVVAPSTPLPTMRKPAKDISIIRKTSLEQVSELASYSPYYTRSLNEKVLSIITLDRGQTVSLKNEFSGNLKKFHDIGSTSVHIGSSGREEKTVAKEDRGKASVVVAPSTPLPTIRKPPKAISIIQKKSLEQVSELASYSPYYTRSLNEKVLSTITLDRGQKVSLKGKESPLKTTGSASKAWKQLLKKDGIISVELEFHQKVTSFISKVGKIQGQRVFSPWKGSVLDSIIGALLTQRVSDNLSSFAFMSLGVIFPQDRCHDTYNTHHRMMREQRSKGGHSSPNLAKKRSEVKLSAKSAEIYDDKEGKNSSVGNHKPDWKTLRTEYSGNVRRERGCDAVDYVDWHAVRRADVKDVSKAILLRGMNKKLARRIKVDVNVGRVMVRLGWVPVLTNTSDELLMSLLEKSSNLDLIHQYLWPRLRKLDQNTLYELHYQMITFGKVFCTKKKPSCAECPMKRECKSYAEIDIEDTVGWDRLITQKMLRKAKTPFREQSLLRPKSLREKTTQSSSTGRSPKKIGTWTQHFVYELPDQHPILTKFDDRDPDDSSPYLLVISESDPLATDFSQIVSGTVMIPYRTVLRGNFPLNGTYFQPNEVFADQQTSQKPIDVLSKTLQDLQQLQRKALYCGSDLSNLVKGFSSTEVKSLFNEGYICTRGFDRKTSAPVALGRLLHISS